MGTARYVRLAVLGNETMLKTGAVRLSSSKRILTEIISEESMETIELFAASSLMKL